MTLVGDAPSPVLFDPKKNSPPSNAPIMQPKPLNDCEMLSRPAEQCDVRVGCGFEQHKSAPYDEQRQQDKFECAYAHSRQKQKCACGKQQQTGNHAGACAEAAYEQPGRQCPEEICQIDHGLHECRACLANVEYELVMLVEHVENGSCSTPQKEK